MLCRVVCTLLKIQKEKQVPHFTLCIFHRQNNTACPVLQPMTRGVYTIPTTVEPCFVLRLPKISLPQAHRQSQAYRLRQVRRLFLIRLHRRLKNLCQSRRNHIALRERKARKNTKSPGKKRAKNTRQLSPIDMVRENGKRKQSKKIRQQR